MSKKQGPFDVALEILKAQELKLRRPFFQTQTGGLRREQIRRAIRILKDWPKWEPLIEAARKVDKKTCLDEMDDCYYSKSLNPWGTEARILGEIRALLESLPEKGERIKTKIPLEVVFPGNPEIPPEKVAEYVYMPSGDIVVRVEGGDSLWFNKHGIHPKSRLIFKED